MQGTWKDAWKKLKVLLKSKYEERRVEEYKEKQLQSEIYRGHDENVTSGWSVISTQKNNSSDRGTRENGGDQNQEAMRSEEVRSENRIAGYARLGKKQ